MSEFKTYFPMNEFAISIEAPWSSKSFVNSPFLFMTANITIVLKVDLLCFWIGYNVIIWKFYYEL